MCASVIERGRLTSLDHTRNSTTLAGCTYGWDAANPMTSMNFSPSTYDAEDATFTYDDASQLTGAARSGTSNDETYVYDENGNRTSVTRDGGLATTWQVGSNNRLTDDGTFTYTYDDEGNRLTKVRKCGAAADDKTVEYTWDYRNRLTKVTFKRNDGTVTKTVENTYDMFNRWTKREFDPDGALGSAALVTDKFLWDGTQLLVDVRSAGGALVFAHGPGVDMLLFEDVDGGTLYTLLGDHLGTIRDVIATNGTVENHLVYSSFGVRLSETGGGAYSPLHGFTGRPFEITSGLGYNLNRWYDAAVGRWISEDPIGFNSPETNLNRYVSNSPIRYIDPSGLILAAIDGTESDDFTRGGTRDTDVAPGSTRSHVQNFHDDAKEEPKRYWDGPEVLGLNTKAIMMAVYNWIKHEYFALRHKGVCDPPIDLVGHSRGGYIAVEVARKIKNIGFTEYGRIGPRRMPHQIVLRRAFPPVRFIGLYDPVDMDVTVNGITESRTIPGNVQHAANVLAAHGIQGATERQRRSRDSWTRVDGGPESSNTVYSELYVFGTHSALGGAPWDGPHPIGHSQDNDIRAAIKADQFVRARAIDAGVNINQKTDKDYGYRRRPEPAPFPGPRGVF